MSRVIINFTQKCALNCEWCYVSFGSTPAKLDLLMSIIEHTAKLGFKEVTLGGGDPFQYKFLDKIVQRAHELGLFVHVDTHAKSMRCTQETIDLIANSISLIGLPLDGPNAEVHDRMRSSFGHFDLIQDRIRFLKEYRHKLKINTIISQRNISHLSELVHSIATISPSRWSLYEYWPLGAASNSKVNHQLKKDEFREATQEITGKIPKTIKLEVNDQDSRRATYPIVHHDGSIFLHETSPINDFRYIGNFLEITKSTEISSYLKPEREQAKSRYLLKALS